MKLNDKPIKLRDKKAVRLAKERAVREGRSFSNAAAQTIIEALGNPASKNTQTGQIIKDKN